MNTTASYFSKKLRTTKHPKFAVILLLPAQCVMEQSLVSIRMGSRGLAGRCVVSQDQDPYAHRTLAHVCTHPPIPEQGRNRDKAATPTVRVTEGTFPPPDLPPGKHLRAGRTLHLITGYLEHLVNCNGTGEVHSTGNHDQPDSRQDLKHRPAPNHTCQLILPHFPGQADSPRTILITNTASLWVLRDTVPQ